MWFAMWRFYVVICVKCAFTVWKTTNVLFLKNGWQMHHHLDHQFKYNLWPIRADLGIRIWIIKILQQVNKLNRFELQTWWNYIVLVATKRLFDIEMFILNIKWAVAHTYTLNWEVVKFTKRSTFRKNTALVVWLACRKEAIKIIIILIAIFK